MDIYEKLSKIVKKFIKGKEITPESKLKDLGLDSLDIADILAAIEENLVSNLKMKKCIPFLQLKI